MLYNPTDVHKNVTNRIWGHQISAMVTASF